MTDRELIELAARAAGYKAIHSFENNDSLMIEVSERKYEVFNPLTSDADAFRLAVAVEICVSQFHSTVSAGCVSVGGMPVHERVTVAADRLPATRRAITRAAAEIGRGMV